MKGAVQMQAVLGGGSYYSHSDLALHFGVGRAESIDRVEVDWPRGLQQEWTGLKVNRRYEFVEGRPEFEAAPLDRHRAPASR